MPPWSNSWYPFFTLSYTTGLSLISWQILIYHEHIRTHVFWTQNSWCFGGILNICYFVSPESFSDFPGIFLSSIPGLLLNPLSYKEELIFHKVNSIRGSFENGLPIAYDDLRFSLVQKFYPSIIMKRNLYTILKIQFKLLKCTKAETIIFRQNLCQG